MPRFVLLLAPEAPATGALSVGETGRRTEAFAQWVSALAREGRLVGAARTSAGGVRLSRAGRRGASWRRARASSVSGCLLIEAADLDAAVETAASCPGVAVGSIEVLETDIGTELGAFDTRRP